MDYSEGPSTTVTLNNEGSQAYLEFKVLLPLVQGTLWTLALSGWRYWNRTAEYGGASLGSRVRRWWWNVNNWSIPEAKHEEKMASQVGEVSNFL